ncbi:unnamed protein product [Paramecium sonneborni]|uniref:Cyclic nucleotide-binding domain-containing protein n=1 Tax=Paramecium sonneborni TaxID=65129 RepID=A0A8S1LBJ9_9CILI|nr:unnamed protein product [Paramecium sonneborni]
MHLIPKLIKEQKTQEDIYEIYDHLSQLHQFQAPYEVLKDLCKRIGYSFFETGQIIEKNSNMAYYVIKGVLKTTKNLEIQANMWYEGECGFEAQTETHCFTLPLSNYKKFSVSHNLMYQQKKKTLIFNLPILEKLNYRIHDQLIKGFQEIKFVNQDFIQKMDEPSSSLYILQNGILAISKIYEKNLSQYEKLVLPKKFWSDEILIEQLINNGIIGEELSQFDKALYNVQVVSKTATLLMISIQQLKSISQQIFQAIFKISNENNTFREEIYQKKCLELEKLWQNVDKNQILNQDIKKTITFKVLQKKFQSQDQQSQTVDDNLQYIIGNLSYKKMPKFIQQYFRQKNNKIKKKQDLQSRNQNSNSQQQIDQTQIDSQILLAKVQQKIQQQNPSKLLNCQRLFQVKQFNRNKTPSKSEHIRPNTSQILFQFNISNNQEKNKLMKEQKKNQMINKTIISNLQNSKANLIQSIKMQRSSSVFELKENTSHKVSVTQSKTPRENVFQINFQQNQIGKKIKVNQLLLNSQIQEIN